MNSDMKTILLICTVIIIILTILYEYVRTVKNNIAIFVSEWGINQEQGSEAAIQQGEEFVSYLNEEKISWIAWALCNKDETFAAIKPDCTKYSHWTKEDFSTVGQVFFNSLSGQGNINE